jgi:excisionase family DNA binding protein
MSRSAAEFDPSTIRGSQKRPMTPAQNARGLLTPKQVARAIGVSESSLKRWCDKGVLPMHRTVGGHRRIALNEVIQFLRRTGHDLVRPEVLGLPSITGRGETTLERSTEQMRQALLVADEQACRTIVFDLYLAGQSVCDICDRVLADAFHGVGDLWQCGDIEVYQERRACEICLRVLFELRSVLPEVPLNAPLAIGGTVRGDPYRLATTMVEMVLREEGWQAQSFGTNLPLATLRAAIDELRPRLFWLSVSHLDSLPDFLEEYSRLFESAASHKVAVAVGGRALTEEIRGAMEYTTFCEDLHRLVAFAKIIKDTPAQ